MSDTTARISEAAGEPVPSLAGIPAAPVTPARPPPGLTGAGPLAWAKLNLFGSITSSIVTIVLAVLLVDWGIKFVNWAFVHAVWSAPELANGRVDNSACSAAQGQGACWALIDVNWRLILFGRFPYDEQLRPGIAVLLFLGLYGLSANRAFWRKELLLIWLNTLVVIGELMWGGDLNGFFAALLIVNGVYSGVVSRDKQTRRVGAVLFVAGLALGWFGPFLGSVLTYVPQDSWGGLPLTLILSTFGLVLAFPLAVLVALGRRSRALPAVRMLCVVFVELIRGVPLISLLFMAKNMFPLFVPGGRNPDALLLAQLAFTLFAAAYLAEVIRGGLLALPKGQYEAADALGLGYWHKTGLIILPQALRLVIPPLVNTFIGFFKDTSLVSIISIFDLLLSGQQVLSNNQWTPYSNELYLFLALIYFAFCYVMARYSRGLERKLGRTARR